ncbi:hypothetical protein [Bacillus cereus]|uniref:hypothetical protein n=1 Tax=Bacillus cereus TaxID=1396 RepID=UPI0005A311E7|nr:hypothetical protein [Bacillus cereus]AJG56673.1 putative amino acid transporter [Bacillus cereus D17]QKI10594.1 hypothetical protein FOC91_00600 [Bacillus cereus]
MKNKKKRNRERKGGKVRKITKLERVKNSPYYVEYWLNGEVECQAINETNYYDACVKAFEILKNEKDLKLKRDATIKLVDNRRELEYSLKWKKHPPLSGDGGYFTNFEPESQEDEREVDVKPKTHFKRKYGISLTVFLFGMLMILIPWFLNVIGLSEEEFFKEQMLINKYYWFVTALVYGSVSSYAKAEGMKSAKSRTSILCYNFILDSPIWLGAIMTMSVFYETNAFGDEIYKKIAAGLLVFIFLVLRLGINYTAELNKYYKDKFNKKS